jgi:predicted transcriptional regulator
MAQLVRARPGDEWSREQSACVDMIVRALQRPTSIRIPFKIDRIDKAGSVGKTTDSLYSDLDLVTYIVADAMAYLPPNNNDAIRAELIARLRNAFSSPRLHSIEQHAHQVVFELDGQSVDLVLAREFCPPGVKKTPMVQVAQQTLHMHTCTYNYSRWSMRLTVQIAQQPCIQVELW